MIAKKFIIVVNDASPVPGEGGEGSLTFITENVNGK